MTTRDNKIEELEYKTEKHDYKNILKSLIIDKEHYIMKRKKFKREEMIFTSCWIFDRFNF